MVVHSSKYFTGVIRWLSLERDTYQTEKFDYEEEQNKDVDYWIQQFDSYIQRLPAFGLDTLAGTQAVLKLAATAVALSEHLVEKNGFPRPGVSSGNITLWDGVVGSRLNAHLKKND